MMPIRRRRRLTTLLVVAVVVLTVLFVALPPDSPVVLAVVFNGGRLRSALSFLGDRDAWLRARARHPVHLASEVGCLIKTGYGTRHRVREQLSAFAVRGGVLGDEGRDYLVVGDWEANGTADSGARAVDAVGLVMRDARLAEMADHERFGKYRSLRAAVEAGDEVRAAELGARFGWELDALKVSFASMVGWEYAD